MVCLAARSPDSGGGGGLRGGCGRGGARSAHGGELMRGSGVGRALLPWPALDHKPGCGLPAGGRGRGTVFGDVVSDGESLAEVSQRWTRRSLVTIRNILQLSQNTKAIKLIIINVLSINYLFIGEHHKLVTSSLGITRMENQIKSNHFIKGKLIEANTYIFLGHIQKMVLSIEHIVFLAGYNHDAVILVLREADVDVVVVHNAFDVFTALANEAAVDARINVNLLSVLAVLR